MADQPQDPTTSKKNSEKQQPETVLLTADELRAIAGGALSSTGSPNPTPKDITRINIPGK